MTVCAHLVKKYSSFFPKNVKVFTKVIGFKEVFSHLKGDNIACDFYQALNLLIGTYYRRLDKMLFYYRLKKQRKQALRGKGKGEAYAGIVPVRRRIVPYLGKHSLRIGLVWTSF